jgi:hydrogenase maturation protease
MNLECVEKIAEAVLYEGYMLYPYRASSVKNQQRWNFGVLCPRSYSEQQEGSDAWMMQTECLLEADSSTQLEIEVRFLQVVNRSVARLTEPLDELPTEGEPEFELVDKLVVDGHTFVPWQEAREREVCLPTLHPAAFSLHRSLFFEFPFKRELEPLRNQSGMIEGIVVRTWETVSGSVEVELKAWRNSLIKATVRLHNLTLDGTTQQLTSRAEALRHSLVSAHTILGADGGQFVSLLDPPQDLSDLAAECTNLGTWPVLVGEDGARDAMLSSPIILYDYPEIATESPGDLFDATEIDEILTLRILTLTDDEKQAVSALDVRGKALLERTEALAREQLMGLHGTFRGLRPVTESGRPHHG